jgi:large subunit ribosomal protein L27e
VWYESTCDNLEKRETPRLTYPKAIISRGRYAGKKVVLLMPVDNGSKGHPFPHAIVAGIERYPSTVTKRMSKARQAKRSKVKPFIKVVMPTRYTLELEGLKNTVTSDTFKEVSQREEAKKIVKKTLDERYQSGKNRWFFTPLREYTRKIGCEGMRYTNSHTGF